MTKTPGPRRLPLLTTLLCWPLALAACGAGGPAYAPVPPGVAVVEMTDGLAFAPERLKIKVGETVEWRNTSLFTHTVTDEPGQSASSRLPPGAEPFSARVAPGEVYRHTFTVPGSYAYYCMPHEDFDMRGTIDVVP